MHLDVMYVSSDEEWSCVACFPLDKKLFNPDIPAECFAGLKEEEEEEGSCTQLIVCRRRGSVCSIEPMYVEQITTPKLKYESLFIFSLVEEEETRVVNVRE